MDVSVSSCPNSRLALYSCQAPQVLPSLCAVISALPRLSCCTRLVLATSCRALLSYLLLPASRRIALDSSRPPHVITFSRYARFSFLCHLALDSPQPSHVGSSCVTSSSPRLTHALLLCARFSFSLPLAVHCSPLGHPMSCSPAMRSLVIWLASLLAVDSACAMYAFAERAMPKCPQACRVYRRRSRHTNPDIVTIIAQTIRARGTFPRVGLERHLGRHHASGAGATATWRSDPASGAMAADLDDTHK